MKKIQKLLSVIMGIAFVLAFASCATTKEAGKEASAPAKKVVHVERYAIDWDGAEMGSDKPEWPVGYKEDGMDSMDIPAKIKNAANGKITILIEGEHEEKKLAREQARNGLGFQLAQQLNTVALTTYNEVIEEGEQSQQTLQATASKAQFTGFERIGETWVQVRTVDHDKDDKITDVYRYYDLFACDKDSFAKQAKKYLNDVLGEVTKSEDRNKVEDMSASLVDDLNAKGSISQPVSEDEQ